MERVGWRLEKVMESGENTQTPMWWISVACGCGQRKPSGGVSNDPSEAYGLVGWLVHRGREIVKDMEH